MSAHKTSNAGAVALAALKLSHTVVASACGVARSTSAHWRDGSAKPRREARGVLRDAYGIDVNAWDREADAPPKKAAGKGKATGKGKGRSAAQPRAVEVRKLPPYPKSPANPTTLDSARHRLACLAHDMAHRDLPFGDVMKVRAEESRALALVAKLEEKAELSEDRYVTNHPAWRRLREKMIAALAPYPDACAALIEAME